MEEKNEKKLVKKLNNEIQRLYHSADNSSNLIGALNAKLFGERSIEGIVKTKCEYSGMIGEWLCIIREIKKVSLLNEKMILTILDDLEIAE